MQEHKKDSGVVEEEPSKSLFIIKSDKYGLINAENYLKNREWELGSSDDLRQAMVYILNKKPTYVMVTVDHSNSKVEKLPTLLKQTFPVKVIVFAESHSSKSLHKLRSLDHPYTLMPPISGPMIERMVNKIIRDEEMKDQQGDPDDKKYGSYKSGDNNDVISIKNSNKNESYHQRFGSNKDKNSKVIINQDKQDYKNSNIIQEAKKSDGRGTSSFAADEDKEWDYSQEKDSKGKNNLNLNQDNLDKSDHLLNSNDFSNDKQGNVFQGKNKDQADSKQQGNKNHKKAKHHKQNTKNKQSNSKLQSQKKDDNSNSMMSEKDSNPDSLSSQQNTNKKPSNKLSEATDKNEDSHKSDSNKKNTSNKASTAKKTSSENKWEALEENQQPQKEHQAKENSLKKSENKNTQKQKDVSQNPFTRQSHNSNKSQSHQQQGQRSNSNNTNQSQASDSKSGMFAQQDETKGSPYESNLAGQIQDKNKSPNQRLQKNKKGAGLYRSVLEQATQQALNVSTNFGNTNTPQELGENENFSCISINSQRYNGYLLAAGSSDKHLDDEFIKTIKTRVIEFLESRGEHIYDQNDLDINITKINYSEWSEEEAEFFKQSIHNGEEIGMAFFESQEIKHPLFIKETEDMLCLSIDSILEETKIEFDLFIFLERNNKFLKITKQGGKLFTNQKQKLVNNGIKEMHVPKNQKQNLVKYRAQNYLNDSIQQYLNKKKN